MRIQSTACTHVGRRENNEDAYCVEPRLGLYAVADGMGGYEGGEVASRIAVDTVRGFFDRNARDDDTTWPYALDRALSLSENMVSVAVRLANARVCAQKKGRLDKMGSTFAGLLVRDEVAVVAHVGDSRVYRLRGGQLERLTRDHSMYEEMLASGLITPVARADFPYANVITRALGMPADRGPELRTERLAPGDVYLVCTDGLLEALAEDAIARELSAPDPLAACERLVRAAFEAGGRDNITAVVVAVTAGDAAGCTRDGRAAQPAGATSSPQRAPGSSDRTGSGAWPPAARGGWRAAG